MRNYTYKNEAFFYAKGIFYRSLDVYKDAAPAAIKQMVEGVKEQLNMRLEDGTNDSYTIAARWFIRIENYLNKII